MKSNLIQLNNNVDDVYKWLARLSEVRAQISALEKEKDVLTLNLRGEDGYFAKSDQFVYHGRIIAAQKLLSRESLDTKSLKLKEPAIYAVYTHKIMYFKLDIYL